MDALDHALRRYGIFDDDDVVGGAGLSVRSWRELIKTGAVATIPERRGRGQVRLCDDKVFKRASVIAALNRTGLSLAVSGQVAYSLPFHSLLYEIVDPWMVLFERAPLLDGTAALPPRLKKPLADWFAPDRPAAADAENDWFVTIYDGRFVAARYSANEEPVIFGDLRDDGASFVAWWPPRGRISRMGAVIDAFARRHRKLKDAFATWGDPQRWTRQLRSLGYRFERHESDDDPLCAAADESIHNPVFMTSINVTLAIRRSLRRYLGIEPEPAECRSED